MPSKSLQASPKAFHYRYFPYRKNWFAIISQLSCLSLYENPLRTQRPEPEKSTPVINISEDDINRMRAISLLAYGTAMGKRILKVPDCNDIDIANLLRKQTWWHR